ncbi:MAG TPA: HAMP domain-containing sensor histidine kinase [Solirubrobacterales bacterium]|nr:HAMP domain-containing sensor histidine kinase [Solirubrobacterales bacterium]
MSRLRSLRTQIVVSVTVLIAVGVALSGLVIAWRIDQQDRAQVDRQLRARAAKVQEDADKGGSGDSPLDGGNKDTPGAGGPGNLLAGTESLTRVLAGDTVVAERGDGPLPGAAIPTPDGLATVTIEGQSWRSLVEPTASVPDGRLQVLESLAPVEQRLHDNWRSIAIVTALTTLLTALAAWLVAGYVLRPLQRLRRGAMKIGPGAGGDQRLPDVAAPTEIAELSATLNEMIERQQRSMEATRRFTADAGHEIRSPLTGLGMDIETLQRNPHVDAETRAEMLQAMGREHERIVALLDGLQALARGDAEALPDRELIEVRDLVERAVEEANRRHPGVAFSAGEAESVTVEGWPDGLRLALDNLLNNSALHGRADGTVEVHVASLDGGAVRIGVSDDGPGIPAANRERLRERFARGERPRASGSGLGLALVDQQARLHGGRLELHGASTGGLEATLLLPRTRRS